MWLREKLGGSAGQVFTLWLVGFEWVKESMGGRSGRDGAQILTVVGWSGHDEAQIATARMLHVIWNNHME